jgi:hypothetical protein
MIIIGAGLAGLIAAHAWPRATITETSKSPIQNHKALLRFRSDSVSHATAIPFRRVTVRKGILHNGKFEQPSVRLANLYSRKVTGTLLDRSIWNIETAHRFIAPENFYERLLEQVGQRICWGEDFDFAKIGIYHPVPHVSTAPMPVAARALGEPINETFSRSKICVLRWRIEMRDADVYQTVYFPTPTHNMYRASITGNLLIAEFIGDAPTKDENGHWLSEMLMAFALEVGEIHELESTTQRYGKISPIDEQVRRSVVRRLSEERGIYSLGRFATWRNLLLDDVVQDITVIKRLMAADSYDGRIKSS